MQRAALRLRLWLCVLILVLFVNPTGLWASPSATHAATPQLLNSWWFWPLALFLCCIVIGMLSVAGGVGSGILYLALVSAIFPFHIDYVRVAAILVSLAGALIAGSGLLRRNLADVHLMLPTTLVSSLGAICGAVLGMYLPTRLIQIGLGITILIVALLLTSLQKVAYPSVVKQNPVGMALKMYGRYQQPLSRQIIAWQSYATLPGLLIAFPIGFFTGVFGLEGGWAHIAAFNLIMGVPFKVAVGTSKLLLTFTHTAAGWIYMNQGCVLPLLAIPSIIGVILGSLVGLQAQLALTTRLKLIRQMTLALLILGGIKVLIQGLVP